MTSGRDDEAEPPVPIGCPVDFGHYERLVFAGHGGAASVYSAVDSRDGSLLAIKVFHPSESSQYERQLSAGERLGSCDGVLRMLDHGMLADGRRYLVSPFVPGGTLWDRLERFGPMSAAQTATVGSQIARCLARAHSLGVLHCDLKPSNVLLDDDVAVLADFGASRLLDLATTTETLAITVAYAAPEVLEGADWTERCDVYSLGLTLQTVATGRHPFGDKEGLAALVNQICSLGPVDPSTAGLPDGLAAVLRHATALDPEERYATAAQFADALDAVALDPATPPVGAAPDRRLPAVVRNPRRRWLVGVGLAIVLSGVAIAIMAQRKVTAAPKAVAATSTTRVPSPPGPPVSTANGVLGPLYSQDEFTYAGQLTRECEKVERWVAIAIHADRKDRAVNVGKPWVAVKDKGAGSFMAYLPCESSGTNIRYVLPAPGRWFAVVAKFPTDQYDQMVEWMRENETSPAPDYTINDAIRTTLANPKNYKGWSIVDREK